MFPDSNRIGGAVADITVFRPEAIVGIGGGGLIPARILRCGFCSLRLLLNFESYFINPSIVEYIIPKSKSQKLKNAFSAFFWFPKLEKQCTTRIPLNTVKPVN